MWNKKSSVLGGKQTCKQNHIRPANSTLNYFFFFLNLLKQFVQISANEQKCFFFFLFIFVFIDLCAHFVNVIMEMSRINLLSKNIWFSECKFKSFFLFCSLSQSAKLIVKLTLQSLQYYQVMRFTTACVKSSLHVCDIWWTKEPRC